MKKFFPFILLILLSTLGYASLKTHFHRSHKPHKKIHVAIVDTGLDLKDPRFKDHLCPTGHKNFVPGETLDDINNHGTFVAGLIQRYADNSDFCLLIYKYYSNAASGEQNLQREVLAMQEAVSNGADIVNYSGGGPEFNEEEFLIIRNHPKTIFVVAAGNEHQSLDVSGNEFYPASYFLKNEHVVSANAIDGFRLGSSNWGSRVTDSELGDSVLSFLPNDLIGIMSGTSMACAIFSGKLVDRMSRDVQ